MGSVLRWVWLWGCVVVVSVGGCKASVRDVDLSGPRCSGPYHCAIDEEDYGRELERLMGLCDEGDPVACGDAGYMHMSGRGTPLDHGRAFGLLRRACRGEVASACGMQAVYHVMDKVFHVADAQHGERVTRSPEIASTLALKGCEGGDQASCVVFGKILMKEDPDAAAVARAKAIFEEACEQDSAVGCHTLGLGWFIGLWGEAEPLRAAPLLERACERGEAGGCFLLGVMLKEGRGVAPDEARSRALIQQACTDSVAHLLRKRHEALPARALSQGFEARLMGFDLTRQDVEREVAMAAMMKNVDPAAMLQQRAVVLDELVQILMIEEQASNLGLSVSDEEVQFGIAGVANSAGADVAALRQAVRRRGVAWEDYETAIRRQLLTKRVLAACAPAWPVDEADVIGLYRQRHEGRRPPINAIASLSLIYVAFADNSKESIDAARARMAEIVAEIDGGMAFDEAARRFSAGASAADGGKLGRFSPEDLSPVLRPMFTLSSGERFGPVELNNGLRLFMIDAIEEGYSPQVSATMDGLRLELQVEAYRGLLKRWFEALLMQGDVQYNE